MLLVQFWTNCTCDVWKFCQIGLVPLAHPILANIQTSLVLLIPNYTRISHDYVPIQNPLNLRDQQHI